jgi:hypothetical protein
VPLVRVLSAAPSDRAMQVPRAPWPNRRQDGT